MSMYDFNQEEDQKNRVSGPIPAGSSVLVRLALRRPKFPYEASGIVGTTQKGMLFLDVEYEVSSGQFQGSKIWENLWLPLGLQPFTLSDGQKTACNIAGAKMKAILNAARGVMPKDDSPQARQKRQTQSWHDFSNLLFPVTVGINAQPVEKEGRTYWNNTVSRIITPDDTRYSELMAGGEIITDGPTTGDGKKRGNGTGKGFSPSQDDPGYDQPPTEAYSDDIPF